MDAVEKLATLCSTATQFKPATPDQIRHLLPIVLTHIREDVRAIMAHTQPQIPGNFQRYFDNYGIVATLRFLILTLNPTELKFLIQSTQP